MIKEYFAFVVGYFISIFSTENFGWQSTIKSGWILLGMGIFFWIIDSSIEKDAKRGKHDE